METHPINNLILYIITNEIVYGKVILMKMISSENKSNLILLSV